jgi:copper chaperone
MTNQTIELTVNGMTCGHCERAVLGALKSVPGVQDVRVDLKGNSATVQGNADVQALIAAVKEEGYAAHLAGA